MTGRSSLHSDYSTNSVIPPRLSVLQVEFPLILIKRKKKVQKILLNTSFLNNDGELGIELQTLPKSCPCQENKGSYV